MTKITTNVLELRERLDQRQDQFARVLGASGITPARMIRVIETAALRSPKLLECSFQSIFTSAMQAAQDGLLPDGREGAIVPYFSDKQKTYIAQWLPMIAGIRKKLYQSGEIVALEVVAVYEGDRFQYERGLDPDIKHVPCADDDDDSKLTHVYSVATMRNGYKTFEVMSRAQIEKIRVRSKAGSGPWETDFAEMAKKTVVRRHAKSLPTSGDIDTVLTRGDEIEGEASTVEPLSRLAQRGRPRRLTQSAAGNIDESAAGSLAEPDQGSEPREVNEPPLDDDPRLVPRNSAA